MKRLFITASLLLTLTACSSMGRVEYDCPLDMATNSPQCASMEDAYKLSRNTSKTGTSVFENQAEAATRAAAQPYFGQDSNFPATQTGMPVFQQPKVMRVWLAPYVDADGNLRSGEYTYFATPGAWNYGSLQSPGEASGVFGPSSANELGFNPVEAARKGKNTGRPSVPGNDSANTVPAQPGITQPYQRVVQ